MNPINPENIYDNSTISATTTTTKIIIDDVNDHKQSIETKTTILPSSPPTIIKTITTPPSNTFKTLSKVTVTLHMLCLQCSFNNNSNQKQLSFFLTYTFT